MKAGRSDSPMVYRERVVRSVGVGPMRSRPNEKRIDTSPYSSGAYLSPPPDTSWRRTNSDSALHQSAMNIGGETSLHSPGSQRRGELFHNLQTRENMLKISCLCPQHFIITLSYIILMAE